MLAPNELTDDMMLLAQQRDLGMPSPGGRVLVSHRAVTLVPGISQPYFDPITECPLPWDWTGSSRLAAKSLKHTPSIWKFQEPRCIYDTTPGLDSAVNALG